MNEPVVTITLPAPVETVWDAFRDFDQVRQWHGWETEGDEGSLDDEIRLIYGEGVVASEADRTLHIGGHLFSFAPDGAQTIVTVTRVTPTAAAAEAMDWDAWYDDVDEGWLSFLQQLRFALAYQWGEQRATTHVQADELDGPPAELAAVADGDPGERYEASSPARRSPARCGSARHGRSGSPSMRGVLDSCCSPSHRRAERR